MHNARMSYKLKFHLIAVVLIIITVSVLHALTKPAPLPARIVKVVQYSPTIVTATWGMNCNDRIAQEMAAKPQRYTARPVVPDASKPAIPALTPVTRDNVLTKIQQLCDGQQTCTFRADSATLGDVMMGCYAELKIQYYCNELDRVNARTIQQGSDVTLDCATARRY